MKLADFVYHRDNNFNLLRITAALAVLTTHCFALAIGSPNAEPLRASIGMTLGTIAVDVFFIASGFLVTGSLLRTKSIVDYFWARALRIFPGLFVMLFITVFLLGPMLSTLSAAEYFSNTQTYTYLIKCATLLRGVAHELPGVFEDNPWKRAVNGSLWTMPLEVKMYSILAAGWIILAATKQTREALLRRIAIAAAAVSCTLVTYLRFTGQEYHAFLWLFFMFFSGVSFFFLRARIILSRVVFLTLLLSAFCAALAHQNAFFLVYIAGIAYTVFCLAYIPSGFFRKYNQIGDYSYGVYIYAFPVQQLVAALVPNVSALGMLVISLPVTLGLAALSWHFIESRALELKQQMVTRTYRLFSGQAK